MSFNIGYKRGGASDDTKAGKGEGTILSPAVKLHPVLAHGLSAPAGAFQNDAGEIRRVFMVQGEENITMRLEKKIYVLLITVKKEVHVVQRHPCPQGKVSRMGRGKEQEYEGSLIRLSLNPPYHVFENDLPKFLRPILQPWSSNQAWSFVTFAYPENGTDLSRLELQDKPDGILRSEHRRIRPSKFTKSLPCTNVVSSDQSISASDWWASKAGAAFTAGLILQCLFIVLRGLLGLRVPPCCGGPVSPGGRMETMFGW